MSAPEMQVRDADLDAAILAGQVAVCDMASDWYCPRDAELPRRECPECIAEVAVRAVYARLQARWDARDKALRALIALWRGVADDQSITGRVVGPTIRLLADELERAMDALPFEVGA